SGATRGIRAGDRPPRAVSLAEARRAVRAPRARDTPAAGRLGGRGRHERGRLRRGGGVFMNVKANMLLTQEDWVEALFAFPSCGDESNAVGAAYLVSLAGCRRWH